MLTFEAGINATGSNILIGFYWLYGWSTWPNIDDI